MDVAPRQGIPQPKGENAACLALGFTHCSQKSTEQGANLPKLSHRLQPTGLGTHSKQTEKPNGTAGGFTNPTRGQVLPSGALLASQGTDDLQSVEAVQYLLGAPGNSGTPQNEAAYPAPFGTIRTSFSQDSAAGNEHDNIGSYLLDLCATMNDTPLGRIESIGLSPSSYSPALSRSWLSNKFQAGWQLW